MIKIVRDRMLQEEVNGFLGKPFSEMVKFVADLNKEVVAFGGELHADAESLLLEEGSQQSDLWGGNFYPGRPTEERIEYPSLINIRPSAGNPSMELTDPKLRKKMQAILDRLLP